MGEEVNHTYDTLQRLTGAVAVSEAWETTERDRMFPFFMSRAMNGNVSSVPRSSVTQTALLDCSAGVPVSQ